MMNYLAIAAEETTSATNSVLPVEAIAILVVLPALMICICLGLYHLIKSPNLANRVIALDLLTSIGIGIMGVYAVAHNSPVLLDIALVSALLTFLSTVAFGYFLERSEE